MAFMISSRSHLFALLAILPSCGGGVLSAATTRQGWSFDSASLSPAPNPDILENDNGSPTADISLGTLASGWRDPANPNAISGVNSDGAWDLGSSGSITITVPIADAPASLDTHYSVAFQVLVVAYQDMLTPLPVLGTPGVTVSDLSEAQTTVATEPPFSTWEEITWSGTIDEVTADTITFVIRNPDQFTSVVDSCEIFTSTVVVPEPSSPLLALLTGITLLTRRQRRCAWSR